MNITSALLYPISSNTSIDDVALMGVFTMFLVLLYVLSLMCDDLKKQVSQQELYIDKLMRSINIITKTTAQHVEDIKALEKQVKDTNKQLNIVFEELRISGFCVSRLWRDSHGFTPNLATKASLLK